MENSIVKISNTLNLTRQEFSILEKNIFHIILREIKTQQGFNLGIGKKGDGKNIDVLINPSELNETNRNRIKSSLEKLTNRTIKIDQSTVKKEYFAIVSPFPYAKYITENGKSEINIEIHHSCKELFLELANGYTKIQLDAIMNLSSTHSIRMYELLSQYAHKGKWEVDIDLLKDYLGLDSGQYKNFTQFQDRILDYSKKEILKNCGLSFSWSITGKDRKKVTKITFDIYQIEQVKKKEINGDVILSMQYLNKLSPSETSLNIKALLKGYTLLQWQIDYLVENKEMHEDIVRVVATIEQMSTSENPIVNKTAYLVKALKIDKMSYSKK
jgi:plasmid replication initiation protein